MVIPNIWDFIIRIFNFIIGFGEQAYNFLTYEFTIFLPLFGVNIKGNILEVFSTALIGVLMVRLVEKLPII